MKLKSFLQGAVSGIILLLGIAMIWVFSGGMPVATSGDPLPLEKTIARIAVHAAMRGQLQIHSSVPADDLNLVQGAKNYKINCAICHGLPDQPMSAIAAGLFPRPPVLMPPKKGVTRDPEGEVYWKIKNGIRLTGMPGYEKTLSETEIWQISIFLKNADKISPAVKNELAQSIYK